MATKISQYNFITIAEGIQHQVDKAMITNIDLDNSDSPIIQKRTNTKN